MALLVGKLTALLDLESSKFEAGLNRAGSSMQRVGGRMSSVGSKMTRGITLPLLGVAAAGIKTAADFEGIMNTMGAVAGVPGPQLEKLSKLALKMGADTVFSANEAAQGMLELSKAGVSTRNIMGGGLKNALDLAAAGELDVGTAAMITSNAMNTFGLSGRRSKEAVDALAGAANASSADVHDLALALSMGGNAAATVGLSIQETTAALAMFADQGIRGSDAGTSLKTMLLNLAPVTKKAKDLQNELGINFFKANGEAKSLAGISAELGEALDGLSQKEQIMATKVLFGTDAFRAANILREQGVEGLRKYADATSEVGAAHTVAEARMKGLPGALERLKGSLETVALAVGDALAPSIEKAAKFLTNLANAFLALPKPVQQTIVTVGALVAAIGPAVWILGKLTSGLGLFLAMGGGGGAAAGKVGLLAKGFGALATTIGTTSTYFGVLRAEGVGGLSALKGALGATTVGAGAFVAIAAAAGVAVYSWSKAIGEARKTSELMHESVMANIPLMSAYAKATEKGVHTGQDLARMVKIQIQNAKDSGASQEDLNAVIDAGNRILADYNETQRNLMRIFDGSSAAVEEWTDLSRNAAEMTGKQKEEMVQLINKFHDYRGALGESTKIQIAAAMEAGNFKKAFDLMREAVRGAKDGIKNDIDAIHNHLRGTVPKAQSAGREVGTTFVAGLQYGINASIDTLAAAAANAVNAAEKAARNAAGAASPSKLFMKVGKDIMDGLLVGMERGQGAIDKIMANLSNVFDRLKARVDRAMEKASDRQKAVMREMLAAGGKTVREMEKQGERLAGRLASLQEKVSDFREGIKAGFEGFGDLVGKATDEAFASLDMAERMDEISDFLHLEVDKASKLATALKTLEKMGAGKELLQKVAQAGMPLAETLIAGGKEFVGFVQKQLSEIGSIVGEVASHLEQKIFGDELRNASKELLNFQESISRLVERIEATTFPSRAGDGTAVAGAGGGGSSSTLNVEKVEITISAKDLKEMKDLTEFFERVRQVVRQKVEAV